MISVLLSAYNEASNPYFWKSIDLINDLKREGFKIEVLVGATDGDDNTLEILRDKGVHTIVVQSIKRSERYNAALTASQSSNDDWILLHHPRSLLTEDSYHSLFSLENHVKWGAFTHEFDLQHPLLAFTSWWSNNVRGDIKNIFYLDHCLFIRRGLLIKVGGIPSVEIFEDTLLSQKLVEHHLPKRMQLKSRTSAIRFQTKGIWAQAFQNQLLKLRFMLGHQDNMINESYEKDLNLNG